MELSLGTSTAWSYSATRCPGSAVPSRCPDRQTSGGASLPRFRWCTGQHFQRLPEHDVHLPVHAVEHEEVPLLLIPRERDVPYRARGQCSPGDDRFLDEGSVLLKHLNTVVDTVADVDKPVAGEVCAVDGISELLRGRRVGVVAPRQAQQKKEVVGAIENRRRPTRTITDQRD